MMRTGNRTIKVQKNMLLEKIKDNKKKHIELYEKAVVAYKEEALEQLETLKDAVNDGSLEIALNLITPINNEDNYDKVIQMFEWEVEDVVELGQNEFREYVQDETDFAVHALMSNMSYSDKFH